MNEAGMIRRASKQLSVSPVNCVIFHWFIEFCRVNICRQRRTKTTQTLKMEVKVIILLSVLFNAIDLNFAKLLFNRLVSRKNELPYLVCSKVDLLAHEAFNF